MAIRVIIGSNSDKITKQLARFLTENGMLVIGETSDAYDLLRKVHTSYPDLVVVDDRMKSMTGYEIAEVLLAEKACPVLALIRPSDAGNYINLNQDPLFCQVVKPCGKDMLLSSIHLMVKTSKSILNLQKEVKELKVSEDKQVIIDEAKSLLMKNMNLSEEEAHRRIQKRSMDKGLPKVKVAELIIRMYARNA